MGATEEVNDEAMAPEGSPQPDISPERDDGLHDQGVWGRVKNIVDPEAFKAAASAEAKNEKAFENMESANDKKDLEQTEEFKYFCKVIFSPCGCSSSRRTDTPQMVITTVASETNLSAPSRFDVWLGVSLQIRIRE